jgi:hypothetical protein
MSTTSAKPATPATPGLWTRFWGEKKNRLLTAMAAVFLIAFLVPWSAPRVATAVQESFLMLGEYAREHVLLCLVPAFFIAGAITVFLNQQSVIRYLGPDAPKLVAYGRRLRLGDDPRRLLLHRSAAVQGDLQEGRRSRPGGELSLLRSGDQHPRDHSHR